MPRPTGKGPWTALQRKPSSSGKDAPNPLGIFQTSLPRLIASSGTMIASYSEATVYVISACCSEPCWRLSELFRSSGIAIVIIWQLGKSLCPHGSFDTDQRQPWYRTQVLQNCSAMPQPGNSAEGTTCYHTWQVMVCCRSAQLQGGHV